MKKTSASIFLALFLFIQFVMKKELTDHTFDQLKEENEQMMNVVAKDVQWYLHELELTLISQKNSEWNEKKLTDIKTILNSGSETVGIATFFRHYWISKYKRCNASVLYDNFDKTNEFNWVKDNAHKYGFIMRYPENKEDITGYKYEPWHYRYVGDIATYIYNNNLTFEEYKKVK